MEQRHGLGEVQDVDVIAGAIDVRRHLRVPTLLAVTEMGAGLEQPTHGKFWQSHRSVSFTGWPDARVILFRGHRTGTPELPAKPTRACEMAGLLGKCRE